MTSAYLLIFGRSEGLSWVLANERMAFSEANASRAKRLEPGDRLFMYTTKGFFGSPARDLGRVSGEAEVTSLVVIGSDSGRMDHLLGGALTLAAPQFASMRIRAQLGGASLTVVHDSCTFRGRPGATVSILAVNGPATGVHTEGLRWPLTGDRLEPGTSRGLSNEFLGEIARVSVRDGCVVVVVPEEEHT